jgi:holo-[acyl-carrier protein] synthase
MILGTGVDIIEVDRIRKSYERFGERFVRRILSDGELGYCLAHRDPAPFLAARFAAKEAISKAFGTGIGSQLGWQDIEVGRKPSGEPFVILHDQGLFLLKERGADHVHLTLSHTQVYAVAVALLECRNPTVATPEP